MKKLLLILNPNAGLRLARKSLPEILALFREKGYLPTVCVTSARGDAVDFAREYAGNYDLLVTAGGDGTLNETLTGMMQGNCRLPLGYLPSGSTNDFAYSLGLSRDLMENCVTAVCGYPQPLDVGRFNGNRYFSYTASFGAFTSATYTTPQNVKNVLGHVAYILNAILQLPEIRPIHAKVESDEGSFEDDYLFGAVCNSTSLGGVLKLNSSEVDMNDGRFETLLVRNPRDLLELNRILGSLAAKKYTDPMLTFIRSSRLKVTTEENVTWTLDGEEAEGGKEVCIENMHDAFSLMCPPKTNDKLEKG